MKKKLLSLFLTLVMALSLAACGADELIGVMVMHNPGDAVGIIGGADGPTSILVGGDQLLTEDGSCPADRGGEYTDAALREDWGAQAPAESPDASSEGPAEEAQPPGSAPPEDAGEAAPIAEDGFYNSAEDVALYLHTYGRLPDNYVTKSEARALGWEGGSVEPWAGEGCAIGGSGFGNNEGLLPEGRRYYECDVDTVGRDSRGARRIVWSDDGLIYYTGDHYESFTLLYGEE